MKILQVHNQYQHAGGEDSVVQMEKELLEHYGHEVDQFFVDNNHIKGLKEKIRVALSTHYSNESKKIMMEQLDRYKPDIVHVHNFFPRLTPSVFDACLARNIPSVMTLHNYRLVCPGALFLRDGKVCEKCVQGSPYHAVKYGCYKSSRLGSFAVARMISYHKKKQTWHHKVDRFIALTVFAKRKFIEAGFPTEKIAVKPNFYTGDMPDSKRERSGALFVGRISQEKGISTLLSAWKVIDYPLRIVGSGPLFEELSRNPLRTVNWLGLKEKPKVIGEMQKALFLVLPSEWYEGFPMVIVEAFACGLPVICSRLGGMAEVVKDGETGIHFEAGNSHDLTQKILWAKEHPNEMLEMGRKAKKVFEEKYSSEVNIHQLISIYKDVISEKKC